MILYLLGRNKCIYRYFRNICMNIVYDGRDIFFRYMYDSKVFEYSKFIEVIMIFLKSYSETNTHKKILIVIKY